MSSEQYIAISVGGKEDYHAPNRSCLLVYALNARGQLPPVQDYVPRPLDPPAETAPFERRECRAREYSSFCGVCHGQENAPAGAEFPDLTRTPLLHTQEGFDQVVLQGVLSNRGMASFKNVLELRDTQAIRAFIISWAQAEKAQIALGHNSSLPSLHQ